jgi:hypothetical protein
MNSNGVVDAAAVRVLAFYRGPNRATLFVKKSEINNKTHEGF